MRIRALLPAVLTGNPMGNVSLIRGKYVICKVTGRREAAIIEDGAVLRQPEVAAQVRQMGYTPTGSTPDELASLLKSESAVYARVIQQGGISAE